MQKLPTLTSLAADLESGRTNARKLVDECLDKIADKTGEGARAFMHVDVEAAIEAAKAMDRLREVRAAPSRFAGIPISIKDLFDIKGRSRAQDRGRSTIHRLPRSTHLWCRGCGAPALS
jgi:aspartyl-tRNA(Asn)/glutamyl-tRNA(Gln) amidotransferase subunit A